MIGEENTSDQVENNLSAGPPAHNPSVESSIKIDVSIVTNLKPTAKTVQVHEDGTLAELTLRSAEVAGGGRKRTVP